MKSVGGPHATRGPRVGQHCTMIMKTAEEITAIGRELNMTKTFIGNHELDFRGEYPADTNIMRISTNSENTILLCEQQCCSNWTASNLQLGKFEILYFVSLTKVICVL